MSDKKDDNFDKLNVGLVGVGAHSLENLVPALQGIDMFNIHSISSREMRKAKKLGSWLGAGTVTDQWLDLLEDDAVDVIVLAADPSTHEMIIGESLRKGKHIFVEKPPARNLVNLKELCSLAQKKEDVKTFVGYNFRYSHLFLHLRELLYKEQSLEVIKIRCLSAKPRSAFWGCDSVLESFLLAVGIHPIETVVNEFGKPSSISVAYSSLESELFALNVTLSFANKKMAILDMGNTCNRFDYSVELLGNAGSTARIDNFRHAEVFNHRQTNSILELKGKEVEHYQTSGLSSDLAVTGYRNELLSFGESIKENKLSESPLEGSIYVYEIIKEILDQSINECK